MGFKKQFERKSKVDRALLDAQTAIQLIGQIWSRFGELEKRVKALEPVTKSEESKDAPGTDPAK